jgi:ubiquinone/menaquinone biosynthesis C-methylase UbiE
MDKDAYYNSKTFKMEFYEGFRQPYTNKLYEIIYEANAKGINQWGTALDPGTGPGMVARELSKKFSKVVGVDSNGRYIEVAKGSSKGYDNIEYHSLKAEKPCSVFSDKSFDLIVISEAAH